MTNANFFAAEISTGFAQVIHNYVWITSRVHCLDYRSNHQIVGPIDPVHLAIRQQFSYTLL